VTLQAKFREANFRERGIVSGHSFTEDGGATYFPCISGTSAQSRRFNGHTQVPITTTEKVALGLHE
jgi:hypothetical protein